MRRFQLRAKYKMVKINSMGDKTVCTVYNCTMGRPFFVCSSQVKAIERISMEMLLKMPRSSGISFDKSDGTSNKI